MELEFAPFVISLVIIVIIVIAIAAVFITIGDAIIEGFFHPEKVEEYYDEKYEEYWESLEPVRRADEWRPDNTTPY